MNILEINKLEFDNPYPELDEISDRLDTLTDKSRVDKINWKGYSYKPDVELSPGYTDNEILLKYYVKEKYFKADKRETNEMVCEDSCVEFFVSPEDDGIYYNIEFNGIGTWLLGCG